MKKNFKFAAIALAAFAMMTACNNNAPEEVALDTTPVMDTVVEEVIDTVVEEEAPVVETTAPAAKKQQTPAKKKTTADEIKEGIQTVKAVSLQTKKDVSEVTSELKKGEGNATAANSGKVNPLGGGKKSAEEAFKKN